MKIYGEDKPSLEELGAQLEHFGTKGMKWGVRKQQRKDRNQQIKGARRNVANRQAEIDAIVRSANKTKDPAQRAKLDKLATKKAKELFEHPDQLTASRMTTGEKWTTGVLLGGAIGLAGASGAVRAAGGGRL